MSDGLKEFVIGNSSSANGALTQEVLDKAVSLVLEEPAREPYFTPLHQAVMDALHGRYGESEQKK